MFDALLASELCELHGFEPQQDAWRELQSRKSRLETYHCKAVGRPGRRTLHLHAVNVWTSLYRMSPSAMAELGYPELADPGRIREVPIETVDLDAIDDLPPVDILKMDLQGGEVEVLEGGTAKLAGAVAIVTEMRFARCYEGEPMFAEQNAALESLGFRLHKFIDLHSFRVPFREAGRTTFAMASQLVDADTAYVPAGDLAARLSADQLIFLAVAADALFDSPDLVLRCLDLIVQRGAARRTVIDDYMQLLPQRYLRRRAPPARIFP